jgi:integrase
MARLRAPRVPEKPVPILSEEELKRLFAACAGKSFAARRDLAILRLLHSTGLRLGEVADLKVQDVDLDENTLIVLRSKGGRPRLVPFGDRAARALDRYLRVRASHRDADEPWLWLSRFGVMGDGGIRESLYRRAEQAGVPGFHPHRLRHQFAHEYLAAGGQEGDLMMLAGWRSRQMLARYGAAKATERAVAAYRRLKVADRL